MNPTPTDDRLADLLAARVTEGLSADEQAELAHLLAESPGEDLWSFEVAAAAATLAFGRGEERLPEDVAARIERKAADHLPPPPTPVQGRSRPLLAWAGWAVAAGLAGVLIWTNRPGPKQPGIEDREKQLRADPSAAEFALAKTEVPGLTARLVWSDSRQEGYLEVRGLPPNDPTKEQYQLWVVDGGRPDDKPVDGGVFDVRPDGTARVPVRNPIPVRKAAAFAVTKEQPGGVVVAKGPHVLVLTPKAG